MLQWFWPFGGGSRMCIGNSFAIYCKIFMNSSSLIIAYTDLVAGIKALIAVVYYEHETRIVDGCGMEQYDGAVAGPVGGKLLLNFSHVEEC